MYAFPWHIGFLLIVTCMCCKFTLTGDNFRTTYAKVLIPVAETIYYRYVFCCPGYKEVDTTDDGSTPGSDLCVRKQRCIVTHTNTQMLGL